MADGSQSISDSSKATIARSAAQALHRLAAKAEAAAARGDGRRAMEQIDAAAQVCARAINAALPQH